MNMAGKRTISEASGSLEGRTRLLFEAPGTSLRWTRRPWALFFSPGRCAPPCSYGRRTPWKPTGKLGSQLGSWLGSWEANWKPTGRLGSQPGTQKRKGPRGCLSKC